ncbi:cytochrome C oxidase Cbb3 [Candidatus Endobugula sertula]|uniref:Cytochrome C oxidase Cbb3 n=1 Tax=Candidatus Endobugula sertula TaxID=62101 RepID=A0A1D2QMT7_9GAMM|nr:cytochrome C oxidase Cbb3 [Candidatus Endobugula sertula]
MQKFDDIRPYNDVEVHPTIKCLLKDDEFIRAVTRFRFAHYPEFIQCMMMPFVRYYLSYQANSIHTVHDLQLRIEPYLKRMIDRTISGLSISGIDNVSDSQPHLFISNHRDIAMDPALINWALHHNNHQTLRIAIGDNLLTKPYVSDLMRLNKSFIVNRSATAPREKLKVAKHLSSYIHYSIVEERENIWIAQREGRAKDGLDRTNSAVVGMLGLSKPKTVTLQEYIHELNIVPVTISYEYDPCDMDKAKELYCQQAHGEYEKEEHEDASSIAKGITGFKGNVHIHFGDVLRGHYENTDQIVAEIDDAIIRNYHIHPSNMVAYRILHGDCGCEKLNLPDFHASSLVEHKQQFEKRIAQCDSRWREILLAMYANPVCSQQSLMQSHKV